MKNKFTYTFFSAVCLAACGIYFLYGGNREPEIYTAPAQNTRVIKDAAGRYVRLPEDISRVICSGPGTLRLLTYLGAQDKIVGVDSIEARGSVINSRPYAAANPQFSSYPQFGEFRGYDSPEKIIALAPPPQVIFKTSDAGGEKPGRLQAKTSIPVVVINYGHIINRRQDLYGALTLMAEVVGKEKRATEIIAFFDELIEDLNRRTFDIPQDERPGCYVGGIAMRGPRGFHSTEPAYPPFEFVNAYNLARLPAQSPGGSHAAIAKEQIIAWDPEVIFVDVSTIRLGEGAGGVNELVNDPAYRGMSAVQNGFVYGVLPYNSYNANFGSIFANAYFIGKVLYPESFSDICPFEEADRIYRFLLGESVFEKINSDFNGMAFKKLNLGQEKYIK